VNRLFTWKKGFKTNLKGVPPADRQENSKEGTTVFSGSNRGFGRNFGDRW